jgi:hypothetical protein
MVVGSNPTRGAKIFIALWPFVEGLFCFINYFLEKEGFLISIAVFLI